MNADRLVDHSAPVATRWPICSRAVLTVLAVVQYDCSRPSTTSISSRPKDTAIRVPSWTAVSSAGATASCGPTLMPWLCSTAATVSADVVTLRALPSTAIVTDLSLLLPA